MSSWPARKGAFAQTGHSHLFHESARSGVKRPILWTMQSGLTEMVWICILFRGSSGQSLEYSPTRLLILRQTRTRTLRLFVMRLDRGVT